MKLFGNFLHIKIRQEWEIYNQTGMRNLHSYYTRSTSPRMPFAAWNHEQKGGRKGGEGSKQPFILYLLSLHKENQLTGTCILKYCSKHLEEKQRRMAGDTNPLLCLRKLLILSYPTSPTLWRLLGSINYLFIGITASMHLLPLKPIRSRIFTKLPLYCSFVIWGGKPDRFSLVTNVCSTNFRFGNSLLLVQI